MSPVICNSRMTARLFFILGIKKKSQTRWGESVLHFLEFSGFWIKGFLQLKKIISFFLVWSPLLCLMYSLLLGFLVNLQDLSYMPLIWVSEFPQWADWFSHPVCFVLSNLLVSMAIAVSHQAIIVSPKVVFPDLRLFLFHECCPLKLLLRIWFSILQNSLSCCKLFLKELSSLEIMNIFSIFKCFSVFSSLWGSAVFAQFWKLEEAQLESVQVHVWFLQCAKRDQGRIDHFCSLISLDQQSHFLEGWRRNHIPRWSCDKPFPTVPTLLPACQGHHPPSLMDKIVVRLLFLSHCLNWTELKWQRIVLRREIRTCLALALHL